MSCTGKAMEEIISYWIESVHVAKRLEELSEYTNEAARIYESAECIMNDAESRLKAAVETAIKSGSGEFAKYRNTDYSDSMEELVEMLYEQFDGIYGSSREEQATRFYQILESCMDDVLLKTA